MQVEVARGTRSHRAGDPASGRRLEQRPAFPSWWRRPLWAHALVLAGLLLVLAAFVGTDQFFSADEGAAVAQVDILNDGEGWTVEHRARELDPDNEAFPLSLSVKASDGTWAPFTKHPTYPLLLAGPGRIAGRLGVVGLSIAGAVATAVLAALLARRIDPSLDRATLWAVGAGSPLLFDSFLVIAHTLGAALVTGATLCALDAVRRRSRALILLTAILAGSAVMLRNEALLFALALGVACTVEATRRRQGWLALAGGAVVAGGAGAYLLDTLLSAWVVDATAQAFTIESSTSLLGSRIQGAIVTLVLPAYDGLGVGEMALGLGVCLTVAAAWVARRRPEDGHGIVFLLAVAAVMGVVRLMTAPETPVPGLILAAPALIAAAVVLTRRVLADTVVRVCVLTLCLFGAGVLATQYPTGGSGEWGGRYFAIGLGVAAPIAIRSLTCAGARLDPRSRGLAAGALVGMALTLSIGSILTLRHQHDTVEALRHEVRSTSATTASADDPEGPIIVTTAGALGRLAWPDPMSGRWLLVDDEDLSTYATRLDAAGIDEVTLVLRDSEMEEQQARIDDAFLVRSSEPVDTWRVMVAEPVS